MEDVVDFPDRGESDFIGNVGYLGDYLERSISISLVIVLV